jgi:hypothetical protein
MPNRAFTVNPVVSSDDAGEPTIQDFEVIGDRSEITEAFNRGYVDDFIEDSEGRLHHIFENVELEDEQYSPTSFDESSYIEAIQEANPYLNDAIAWAEDNLPEEVIDEYNAAIESSDLGKLNEKVEWLIQQYIDNANAEVTEQPTEEEDGYDENAPSYLTDDAKERVDELSDDEADELGNTIDSLTETDPAGEETANEWEQLAVDADDAGDYITSFVAAQTAKFHSGQISAEEAIAACMNQFDLKDLQAVYRQLSR